jgi:hypothetical protein
MYIKDIIILIKNTIHIKLVIYFFYVVLYFILFIFMFKPKIENVVIIMIFILTVFFEFNLIMDIKDINSVTFDFKLFSEFMNEQDGSIVNYLLFSPLALFLISVLLIIVVVLYVTKTSAVPITFIYFLAIYLGVMSFFYLGNTIKNGIPFYIVILIPFILIIVSLIMTIVTIYNYNESSKKNLLFSKNIFLSSIDSKHLLQYKILIIIEFVFIFGILSYLFLYLGSKNTSSTKVQSLLYVFMPIIYGISAYLIFLSNKILQVKFA